MPYTYMLQCSDGSYYTGWTVDLNARLKAHNNGKGARYTQSRLPVHMVYWELHRTRSEAQRREASIRKLSRKDKEVLIQSFNAKTVSIDFFQNFNKTIINSMLNAFALHRIIVDSEGSPCDYEYLEINPSFEELTGLKRESVIGRKVSELIPGIRKEKTDWIKIYGEVAITGKPISFESYVEFLDRWYIINAYSPQKGYFITIFHDISAIKKNEQKLREKNQELLILYEELSSSEEELRQQLDEIFKQQEELQEYKKKLLQMAYYDTVTKLPNRTSLFEKLTELFS